MNNVEAGTARKVTAYLKLVRLSQASQRAYLDAKRAQDHGDLKDQQTASYRYHDADVMLRRALQKALDVTESEIEFFGLPVYTREFK